MGEAPVKRPVPGDEEALRIANLRCRLKRESSSDGLVRGVGMGSLGMETCGCVWAWRRGRGEVS